MWDTMTYDDLGQDIVAYGEKQWPMFKLGCNIKAYADLDQDIVT